MKLRKRILSLVLAVMLVVAMAVPVSAAVTRYANSVSYDDCTFATSAVLNTHSIQNLMELTSIPLSKDYNDYLLTISAMYHVYDNEGVIVYGGYQSSNQTTRINNLNWASTNRYYSSWNSFYVNEEVIDRANLCVV